MRADQIIKLNTFVGWQDYPDQLRRISCVDPEADLSLVFLNNQFEL